MRSSTPIISVFAAPPREGAPTPASKLAEFDTDGNLIRVWEDNGLLQAAYGVAYAPDNFGGLSDTLLVGNFNTGTVVAFDPNTHTAIDYVRDSAGKTLVVNGIWGMVFGNGASLGDTDSLYYAAGPNNAADGVFGHIRWDSSRSLLPADAQIADFTRIADKLLALDPSIIGGDDNNVLFGTGKSDFIQAGKGNNTMVGGKADSVFGAGDGNNTAYGSEGANLFNFGNGHNTIYAGQGDDIISPGTGNDIVHLGSVTNLLILDKGEGSATVWNFKDNDSISFGASVKKADSITTQLFGFDTQVFAGGDLLATLLNTQANIHFV